MRFVNFGNESNLFAGTDGSGVWRRPLLELGIVSSVQPASSEIPDRFKLEQNYPNPFNPSTRIHFSVRSFGFVSLKVYDMLGREVRMLVNEELKPGKL